MARIPYVKKEGAPPEVADVYSRMEANGAPVANLWKMAAHSPSTLLHFIRMGNALLSKTKLAPKLREMAILRGATIVGCDYEIRAHAMFGKEVGLTDEQLQAIGDWQRSKSFNKTERAVLRFVDEVVKTVRVKDRTFKELARHLDEDMMVELAQTVGFYGMIARLVLPFEVDMDEQAFTSSSQITGRSKS